MSLLSCIPVLLCLCLCLPFQIQIQPQTVEVGKGHATIGSEGVHPSQPIKNTHFHPLLHVLRKAMQLVLSGLVVSWISSLIQLITSPHHASTDKRKREGLNSQVQKRGKELREPFLSISSRDLRNGLN